MPADLLFQYSLRAARRKVAQDQEFADRELEDYLSTLTTGGGSERWEHYKTAGSKVVTGLGEFEDFSVADFADTFDIDHNTQGIVPVDSSGNGIMSIREGGVYYASTTIIIDNVNGADSGSNVLYVIASLEPRDAINDVVPGVTQVAFQLVDNLDGTFSMPFGNSLTVSAPYSIGTNGGIRANYRLMTGPTNVDFPQHTVSHTMAVTWQAESDVGVGGG